MNERDIRTAGGLLARAWRENRRIDRFSGALLPADRAAATAVQDEMAKQIGENVVGWKVGGELVGRVFERNLYSSPASLPVERFRDTLVEVELGFRLLANLPARSVPYGVEEVVEAAVLVPTFEFVSSRFAGEWPNPEIESEWLLMAADNAVVAGVVVGAELPHWKGVKLLEIPISASIDGGAPLPLVPPERRRDPVDVLVWLVNHLSGRGIGLAAGQIATLGAAIAGVPMGRSVTAEFGDWGRLEATVADA